MDAPINVAFYAPMKSPRHPTPSGDRQIAQLFLNALNQQNMSATLVSELRSWEGAGNETSQNLIRQQADLEAENLIRKFQSAPRSERPQAWFSYHSYHKAPDWLGPKVSNALDIPYFLAEASVAPKQSDGPWAMGYRQNLASIEQSSAIVSINPVDNQVISCMWPEKKIISVAPFISPPPKPAQNRYRSRETLVLHKRIPADNLWLVTVGMMRNDVKLASYRALSRSLEKLQHRNWSLIVIGDGPARNDVESAFSIHGDKVKFLGVLERKKIFEVFYASDLFLWPAINEAIGMVFLEAMACSLPSVAIESDGVAQVIYQNETGTLVPSGDIFNRDNPELANNFPHEGFACAVEQLIASPDTLESYRKNCQHRFNAHHTIDQAARVLGQALRQITIAQTSANSG
ncbi:MAG: glycosyltransferase family 4 protein [Pseudomonadota bacterium]